MVTVAYATREHNHEFYDYLLSYFKDRVKIVEGISNPSVNGKYISEVYNEILATTDTDVVIFVHDNIKFIETNKYKMPVEQAVEYQFDHNPQYGIIGVGPRCQLDRDITERNFLSYDLLYSQCEMDGSAQEEVTAGPTPKFSLRLIEDDFVDGVFLAVKKSRLKHGFCNSNETFDFYDIDICLANRLEGVKVGLTKAFNLLHYRTREEMSAWDRYEKNKVPFKERWKDVLPFRSEKDQTNVLIVTPCSRPENLKALADSIYDSFKDIEHVLPMWLICHTLHEGEEVPDITDTFNHIKSLGMLWSYMPVRTGRDKIYGGDVMNEAIKDTYANYYAPYGVDPWIYVLDDDNLFCPLMARQLRAMEYYAKPHGKRCLWMSMNREDGFIDTVRWYSVYGRGLQNKWWSAPADEFMPDPSQLVMKYSLLRDMDYFASGYEYDQKLWWYFYEHLDEMSFPEDWHPGHWSKRGSNNFFQCYHDALNLDTIPEVERLVKNGGDAVFSLTVGTNEQCDRFVLPYQQGVDAFNKYKERSPYKYSVLTCIFGNYERLKYIYDYRDDVEYVCVTDSETLTSDQWKIVRCPEFFNKLPETDRFAYVRFHPFNFVSTDVCVTIDASEEIMRDFYDDIVKRFLDEGYEYAVTLHYEDVTLRQNVNSWQNIRGYKPGDYEHILKTLGPEADSVQGEVDGGFIIHKDTKFAHKVNDYTWELCHALSTDNSVDRNFQIELSYVVNTICHDESKIMLIHPYIFEGTFIRRLTHSGIYWIVYNSKEICPCIFWGKKVEPIIFEVE